MHQTFCISERVQVFMLGICIFRRRLFPLGILRHISVFMTNRLSRQSLNTASFPARTLPSLMFSSMLFTFSLVAYSFVIRFFSATTLSLVCQPFLFSSPINTTGHALPISCVVVFLLIRTFSLWRNAVTQQRSMYLQPSKSISKMHPCSLFGHGPSP